MPEPVHEDLPQTLAPPESGPAANPVGAREPTPAELVELLRADQCRRWRRGEPVSVEAYLQAHPPLASADACVLGLILNEIVLREQFEGSCPRAAYLERFPRHAAALRRHFALREAVFSERGSRPDGSATLFEPPSAAVEG